MELPAPTQPQLEEAKQRQCFMIRRLALDRIFLLPVLMLTGCYADPPPVPKIESLEGTYRSPGCQEIKIINGKLRFSEFDEVNVTVIRIKEDLFLSPSRGLVVENGECTLGYYKWQQRIKISKDLSSISLLNRSQNRLIFFSKEE